MAYKESQPGLMPALIFRCAVILQGRLEHAEAENQSVTSLLFNITRNVDGSRSKASIDAIYVEDEFLKK